MNEISDSTVILLKGGRLPSWYQLTAEQQQAFSQEHVALMLSIADKHGMQRLEGFRLIGPQDSWQRFWVIEFPTLEGAESWIEAEMAPPYGLYGYYDYSLARNYKPEIFSAWAVKPPPPIVPLEEDPHNIPVLAADNRTINLLMFVRYRPGVEALTPEERGDEEHVELMTSLAGERDLMRLEAFQLIHRQDDWHRAWIIELPNLEAVEAWIDGEETPPHGIHARREFRLARRWSADYFASWVRDGGG